MENLKQCKICGKKFKKLGYHVSQTHKISLEEYYIKYIGKKGKCEVCGKDTRFINLSKGYVIYCSNTCINSDPKIKNKITQTFQDKYGCHPKQTKEVQNKFKETCLKKYGVENVFQLDEIKEKSQNTCLNKYGVKNAFQNEKIRERFKKTCLEKYGVENPSSTIEVRKKVEKTCLKKFGNKHFLAIREVHNKIKNTFLKKYGVENYSQIEEVIENKRLHERKKMFNKLFNSDRLKGLVEPLFTSDEFQGAGTCKYQWKCKKCGTIFKDNLNNGNVPRCITCFPKMNTYVSCYELIIGDFLKNLHTTLICNNRDILSNNKELDIYIPNKKLSIEFNGLYWHSELNGKDSKYHLQKTLECQEYDIQLLHIFEDEWIEKQDIVKSILKSKLNLIDNKVFARKCELKEVNLNVAKQFLFDNHLQGEINGIHLGLFYNGILTSMLTLGKPRFNTNYEWEILRFCNKIDTVAIGGFSRLLKYFINHYNPNNIITYSDMRYSNGEVYVKNGFKFIGNSNPNYYYMKDYRVRENRLRYQKHLLKDKLEIYDPNLTEWENMQLNGYDRIWDCGNLIFEWRK